MTLGNGMIEMNHEPLSVLSSDDGGIAAIKRREFLTAAFAGGVPYMVWADTSEQPTE